MTFKATLDNKQIETAFTRYLTSTSNSQALMISGKWGTGKTHFFRSSLQSIAESKPTSLKVLYISLNGLGDAEQFDRALFAAAYPIFKTGFIQATGAVLRTLIGLTSTKLDEILKVEASIDRKKLICIDDLERLEPKLLEPVLGKISNLLEVKRCKVVLLCDEEKLKILEGYNDGKEKIVGRTLLYSPTLEDAVRTTLEATQIDLEKIPVLQEALKTNILAVALERVLRMSECRNMRLAISAVRCFAELIESMPSDLQNIYKQNLHQLLHTTVAVSIQLNEKPNTAERIERLFQAPDAEIFDMYAKGKSSSDSGLAFIEKVLNASDAPPIYAHEIFKFVSHGLLDSSRFSEQLKTLFTSEETQEPVQKLERFWRLSQDEFDKAFKDAVQLLDQVQFKSLTELNRITYILFHLSKRKIITLPSEDIMDRTLRAGNLYVRKALETETPAELLELDFTNTTANEDHDRTIENLKLLSQKLNEQNWNKKKRQLFLLIKSDPKQFTEKILGKNHSRSQIFDTPEDLVLVTQLLREMFKDPSIETEKLFQIASAFSRRYRPQDMASIRKTEQVFLQGLGRELRSLEAEIPLDYSLARAALSDLQSAISE